MLIPVLIKGRRHFLVLALGAVMIGALIAPLLAVLVSAAAAQRDAPPRPDAAQTIRIATWNLAGSIPPKLVRRFERRESIWRTTFGPRGAPTPTKRIIKLKIEADVIALQSVSDLRVVRRLFPARQFHTIVSRQLLLAARRRKTNSTAQQDRQTGTTAIIIRRASRWRATRRQHLLRFAGASLRDPAMAHRAAAIAIRIARQDQAFWMLSLELAPPCPSSASKATAQGSPNADCGARGNQMRLLRDWIDQKRALGEDVIIAGSFSAPLAPGQLRVPNTTGRTLLQFPKQSAEQSCPLSVNAPSSARSNQQRQAVSDLILVDVAKRGPARPVRKYWIVPNPNAKHCPLIMDVSL